MKTIYNFVMPSDRRRHNISESVSLILVPKSGKFQTCAGRAGRAGRATILSPYIIFDNHDNNVIIMEMYHGTSVKSARNIQNHGVDVTKGGGELGQGFYVGDLMHKACAWAWNKYSDPAVISYQIKDEDFIKQDVLCLNRKETVQKRSYIRTENRTCSYKFNVAAVWAPVVGADVYEFNQIKFEEKGKSFIDCAFHSIKKLRK